MFLYDYTIKSESNPATVSEVQVNDIGPAGSDKDAFPENGPPRVPFLYPITRWQVLYITSFCADNFAGAVFQLLYRCV